MTDLFERSMAGGGGPEVVRCQDLQGRSGTPVSFELIDCDELTPEGQFPEYGEFLPVTQDGDDEVFWECPPGLAQLIVSGMEEAGEDVDAVADGSGIDPEDVVVDVEFAAKSDSGEWRFVGDVKLWRD